MKKISSNKRTAFSGAGVAGVTRRNFISSPKFVAMVMWRHVLGMGN